jgi:hypothetical protein
MTHENTMFWLRGFLEGKDTLNAEEMKRIKEIMEVPSYPSDEQIEKMVKGLFPDLNGIELRRALLEYKDKIYGR